MTFKVNYGFQKAERDRLKQAKKEAKRREKEDAKPGSETEPGSLAEGALPGSDHVHGKEAGEESAS